ncbi:type IV pilin N-terminal domain-containing protein [Halorussus lipolyticus]|uniref:type IV pilin N-terminal domain-containing protein n=1 Tax=Halorussus lipolyticus TaxID=3034024 RepID=UPI0023E78D78|nr:type IV pilin N-terminal domain-containing protein [Halorussus sp. DT80]
MNLKALFEDDGAVSPVIGVILMVAITVILAAVIGTFVLGLGQNVQSSSPTASISFDQQGSAGSADVQVAHDGGDPLEKDQIDITVTGNSISNPSNPVDDWASDSEITAGESVTLKASSGFNAEDTIKVVWTADGGESSNVLGEFTVE